MALCDSIVVPELGKLANPILIEDEYALPDSALNSNIFHVGEDWLRDEPDYPDSDADTEIMTTPEFYGSLTGGNIAYPGKHEAAIDSSSIHVSNSSIGFEDLDGLPSVEKLQSDHQTLKVTPNLGDEPFGVAGRESLATDDKGPERSPKQGKASKTEEPKEDRNVAASLLITRNGVPEEIMVAGNSPGESLSISPCEIGSTSHRISQEAADNMNRAKCLGEAASTRDSSMSTAVGDALAGVYDHMERCQNIACWHAQAFFLDIIQSPQNTLSRNSKRPQKARVESNEGRVTMRFYVPKMKKGGTWPERFVVNQVILRTDFSSGIPCSLENFQKDDTLVGQGAVVARLEGENPSAILTFSPEEPQGDHARASRKRSDGVLIFESVGAQREQGANWQHGFTGRIHIELYKSRHFLASDYEERKEFFGSVVLNFHSDTVDPKVFLTFSALSSAEHSPRSPAPSNSVRAPPMTSGTVSLEVTENAGSSEGKLPRQSSAGCLKRKFPYDDQSKLRRSERLAKKDKIQQ